MSISAQICRTIHTALALTAGTAFVIVALSGACIVLLHPRYDRSANSASQHHASLDNIHSALQATYPKLYGPWTFELPVPEDRHITAWYKQTSSSDRDVETPLLVTIDAESGRMIAAEPWNRTLQARLHALHSQLLLREPGESLVGWVGIASLGLLVSGAFLWHDARKAPPGKPAHSCLFSTAIRRLHRLTGIFSLPFLIFLVASGIGLSMPGSVAWLGTASSMTHLAIGPAIRSTAEPSARPVGIEEAVLVARGIFPHADLRRITTPAGEIGAYQVELCQMTEANCRHPQTVVWVDRYSGQIRDVQNPGKFSWGQRLLGNLSYYHAGGVAGQWLWFTIGLVPLALFASGLFAWANRQGWVVDLTLDSASLARWHTEVRDFAMPKLARAASRAQRSARELSERLIHWAKTAHTRK